MGVTSIIIVRVVFQEHGGHFCISQTGGKHWPLGLLKCQVTSLTSKAPKLYPRIMLTLPFSERANYKDFEDWLCMHRPLMTPPLISFPYSLSHPAFSYHKYPGTLSSGRQIGDLLGCLMNKPIFFFAKHVISVISIPSNW